jgi:hypothetical protein
VSPKPIPRRRSPAIWTPAASGTRRGEDLPDGAALKGRAVGQGERHLQRVGAEVEHAPGESRTTHDDLARRKRGLRTTRHQRRHVRVVEGDLVADDPAARGVREQHEVEGLVLRERTRRGRDLVFRSLKPTAHTVTNANVIRRFRDASTAVDGTNVGETESR